MKNNSKTRLFCFPCAGGNALFFSQLAKELDSMVEVIALEYAGHGKRNREEFYNNFFELAEDMYSLLKEKYPEDGNYAIMGYSMGSISAIETLRLILSKNEFLPPRHIFLAAHEPYTKKELAGFVGDETDDMVKKRTIQFGGVPGNLVNNKSFWRVYLPVYRADYVLIGKYCFEELNLESRVPATIFYSETDTPLAEMRKWKDYFVGQCEFIEYKGNHFFIQSHCSDMAADIGKCLSCFK